MRTVSEHIEHIQGKPHRVRRQVAFAAAAAGAGLIAFVWLISSFSTGSFAIQGSSFADAGTPGVTAVVDASALAGVAAAVSADTPAQINIVDTTSSPVRKPEQTTLPF